MLVVPNLLSLIRIPLAFLFLQENLFLRTLAIVLAMLTDFLDGQIARRYRVISRFGTTLDPLTDKFFVFFVLACLIQEQRLNLLEAALLMCRDFSVILFGIYLILSGRFQAYRFRAIWCGKIATTLQFFVLLALTLHVMIPSALYTIFLILGIAALGELYLNREEGIIPKKNKVRVSKTFQPES